MSLVTSDWHVDVLEHETFNELEVQERVVLHVDFFNTLAMTPVEIEIMQYIYSLREQFMKAEGVAKVGAQILWECCFLKRES